MQYRIAILGSLFALGCALMPLAGGEDDSTSAADLSAARERFGQAQWALENGDMERFDQLSESLAHYPLAPDLAIAALVQRLNQAQASAVEPQIAAMAGTAPGERLRRLWLGRLAREKRWAEYARLYVDNGSETRECLYRRALRDTGDAEAAFAGLADLYLTGGSLPDVCDPLFAAWAQSEGFDPALVWRRIELLLARGNDSIARFQGQYLPAAEQPWLAFRLAAATRAERFPSAPAGKHPNRARVIAAALADFAARQPNSALELLTKTFADLPPAQAGLVHAAAGLTLAARGERARALAELERLPPGAGSLTLQQKRLRTGLKLGAWELLPQWIEALPKDESRRALWQYWLGRALEQTLDTDPPEPQTAQADATDQKSAGAVAAYRRAADDRSLWGFLAAERLGVAKKIAHRPIPINPERLQELLDSPRAARLRELQALQQDIEIRREWREYARALERAHQGEARAIALREAAALAQALGFRIQAILILARSGYWDDLELRFPLLYTELTEEAAKATGLPPSWLLAIIRQESIFNPDAISPADAMGLMQLLPSTAREVAGRLELPTPAAADLIEPALNIRLGSAYLAYLNEVFDGHEALATAAYNAGPTAVRRWLPQQAPDASQEQPMAADVWIATIPYRETRAYVDRVLTYRVLYDQRLGRPLPVLSELLPPIGPRGPVRPANME
ncbi:lytic transglycosylase domain-containing protein [Thiorhodovibrio frisius]|uniref:Soluble lytic murein transglycosylase-like protein n=1 Tax=Thiorhodovibrio frisius TaxID=631362 RepID=H8Z577_9GAMM|nr:lytic transglycosylase domain-containing protein [Thiorhodovibrio frisius]EIC20484.1 soluble lytic murein transglycosylase-like protein [Thiorhodovibrio frisius]WPL21225.1 Soluble lytic murein transglycosylase precursor [Thiorhodovibrio frisius]